MNLQDLKDRLDDEDVLDFLRIPYVERNGRIMILCPFHSDRHIGSAFIREGRFHCFSCNHSTDLIGLTQEVLGITFFEAVRMLSSLAGVSLQSFSREDVDEFTLVKLSQEELALLDFPRTKINLRKIYSFSPDMYKKIICDKASEKKAHYEYILKNYGERGAINAPDVYDLYDGKINAATYRKIRDDAKIKIRICEDILNRF